MPSPADPVAFELFGVAVRWYAIFILTGIVVAIVLIQGLARRRGFDPGFPLDAAPWIVFAGVLGARMTYVLLRADYFVTHPLDALNIRLGGLSIHGALIAGTAVFWWWCRRRGESVVLWVDLIVPGVALGQAIGRWGNWANQEAFGLPTDLPWALAIDPSNRPPQFASSPTFHPTFLYESVLNIVNTALLSWVAVNIQRLSWLRPGDGVALYCVTYGVGRLVVEGLRTDSLYIGPLPGPVWASIAFVVLGLAIAAVSRRPLTAPGAAAD